MSDILDGMAQIRATFARANITPPTAILLASHDDGMRFLRSISQKDIVVHVGAPSLGKPMMMADGSAWMECIVMGIAVRWPANRTATPDGSWSYT